MNTLKVRIADETREFEQPEFDKLMDELFGQEDFQIHTFNPLHPMMQHVYMVKSSLFNSMLKMIYQDHQIEIWDKNDNPTCVISKV